jgi:type VI secretion system protein ImpA
MLRPAPAALGLALPGEFRTLAACLGAEIRVRSILAPRPTTAFDLRRVGVAPREDHRRSSEGMKTMDAQIYLNPISEAEPVGKYLRWEREYDELEEARRSDEDAPQDDIWRREVKRADWDRVIELGTQILTEKSKDLQVAAFVTEAWAHRRGLQGICDGLDLMLAIQDAFWEKAHPEYGEMDLRRGVYEFLDDPKVLPLRIRSTPLTRVDGAPQLSYSYVKYKEALDTEKKFNQATSEKERSMLEGNFRREQFDEAAGQTPRSFYVELVEGLQTCRAAVERFNEDLVERWKVPRERPPQLSELLTALEEVEKEAKKLLGRKPATASQEVPEPPPEDELPPDEEQEREPADEGGSEGPVTGATSRPTRTSRPRRPAAGSVGPPTSADEALERIVDAAHFLRQADPADPTPYLVLRSLGAGGLYRGDDALASGGLPAPATEVREQLRKMSRESDGGQWADLLDASEQALGRPEGRGWLDPHVYSARALEALGHDGAARACKAILAAWLHDHEKWPTSELSDGTPCASGSTRDWLERECCRPGSGLDLAGATLAPSAAGPASQDGDGSSDGKAEPPDPWDEAQALFRSRRLNDAIAVMVRAVRQARTGRERFLRTLQQAELCLGSDRPNLALPLLEMLAQRVDELRLEQWEDGSLCARVFSHLYRCLVGKDEARAAAVYNRLCQIDAGAALQFSPP